MAVDTMSLLNMALPAVQNMMTPDPTVAVEQEMEEFYKYVEQQEKAAAERTKAYKQEKEAYAGKMKEAGTKAAEPYQYKTGDYLLMATQLLLPILSAVLPMSEKGRHGLRKAERTRGMLKGVGQAAGELETGLQARYAQKKAGEYGVQKENIEHLNNLLDMIYQGQGQQAQTEMEGRAQKLQTAGNVYREKMASERAMLPYLLGKKERDKYTLDDMFQAALSKNPELFDQYVRRRALGGTDADDTDKEYREAVTALHLKIFGDADYKTSSEERQAQYNQGLIQLNKAYGKSPFYGLIGLEPTSTQGIISPNAQGISPNARGLAESLARKLPGFDSLSGEEQQELIERLSRQAR